MPVRPSIHTIKVSLRYMKPPVWRRLQVSSQTSLAELHHIIQAAMGWYDCHLHQFEVRDLYYAAPEHELDDTSDESRRTLANLRVGERFVYWYDFGDDWYHDILVESVDRSDPALTYPRCVTGRRACPPEDCGGPWGFAELMGALGDEKHPEHEMYREWIPAGYDPARFDLAETNEALARLGAGTPQR
jgi:Plasmid pRiA4b ORF-3-like protein